MTARRWTLAFIIGALVLGACSGPGSTSQDPPSAPPGSTAQGYPVTLDNCGTALSLSSAPQRIVTIKSSTTELVLALGLADRLVGTAFLDGPFPEELAAAGELVPVLAERAPAAEVVLAAEPDLVFAGWESTFTADGIGSREELQELGISSYVAPAACQGEAYQPNPLTFEDVFDGIREAGDVLGAPAAAADLVTQQQQQLASITAPTTDWTALWYSSGSDTPFVGGGIGAPQLIMDSIGLTNINSTMPTPWGSVNWEQVAASEPDVIVLVDSAWNTAENKIEVLESNPVTAQLPAVLEGRYLIVPFAASEAGVRTVEATQSLAQQLAQLSP
ncbi:MAG: putative F420-0 ABC transporter substrate-binding protein [Beutenbergiaceae bacterium]